MLQAVLAGEDLTIEWHDDAVLGVVVAAEGYPGDVKKGSVITGLDAISNDAYVYHAGTAKNDDWSICFQWWSCATCCSKRSRTYSQLKQKYIKNLKIYLRMDYSIVTISVIERFKLNNKEKGCLLV